MALRLSILCALTVSVMNFSAAAEQLTLDAKNSKIGFVGSKADGKHEGGFEKFTATAAADFEEPTKGSLEIVIDTHSLWSDNAKLTNHLKNPDFFDVRKYPKITFKSKRIVLGEEEGHVTIHGALTMLGKTVDVEVPAVAEVSDTSVTLKSDFTIDRTKWGMTYGQGQVNNEVAVNSVLVFTR